MCWIVPVKSSGSRGNPFDHLIVERYLQCGTHRCTYAMKSASWKSGLLVGALLLVGVLAMVSWRASLKKEARRIISGVYSNNYLDEAAVSSRRVVAEWKQVSEEYGNATAWQIDNILVQALGTPVAVHVKASRHGKSFSEEWHLHNGKVYSFGVRRLLQP